MADRFDPRMTERLRPGSINSQPGSVGSTATDAGLRSYMLSIYNYMTSGILLTGIVALLFAQSGMAAQIMFGPGLMKYLIIFSPLAIVFAMSFGMQKFSTAAAFAGLSLFGYTTKKDLTGWGSFLIMGVVGLIVASVLNIFLQSSVMGLVISYAAVLIFAGLTAYDTQRLKSTYAHVAGTDMIGKVVIMGALSLYLNFINMFQALLSIMGSRD